ncbi:MAG TPA: hypothetical protein VFH89_15990 [Sphingomicrobium sp.]|nr:hypothetical protein [Sphingomicrobium sp.]
MNDELTFAQWRDHRVKRFVELALTVPETVLEDYLAVQAKSLVDDALRFSRAGLRDDDPMPS